MSSSSNATIITRETLDSNNRNEQTHTKERKRSKHEVQFGHKGVILQQNSHWGAQIYFNNERIWLGTFKSEKEAVMAYDSAALKLRNENGNMSGNEIHESSFQRGFTKEAILNMIRDGSYHSKFAIYIEALEQNLQPRHSVDSEGRSFGQQLFQKELTPSDVGKLNRLVIPKKYALKFFTSVPTGQNTKVIELTFYDKSTRMWKFRYCYWKSSQSFVFTRGWNKFVSAHNLRAGDIITFVLCKLPENNINEASVIYVIEVTHKNQGQNGNFDASAVYDGSVVGSNDVDEEEVEGRITVNPNELMLFSGVEGSNGNSLKGEQIEGNEDESVEEKNKGFKLFGVQIF